MQSIFLWISLKFFPLVILHPQSMTKKKEERRRKGGGGRIEKKTTRVGAELGSFTDQVMARMGIGRLRVLCLLHSSRGRPQSFLSSLTSSPTSLVGRELGPGGG